MRAIRRARRHQRQKGPAVVQALCLPQPPYGPSVTGQLAVPAAEGRRQPDHGVKPIDRQAEGPRKGPDVVPVAVVGVLVGQDVPRTGRLQGRPVEVDGRAQQPKEARGGQLLYCIYPQPPLSGSRRQVQRPAQTAQPQGEEQVAHPQGRGHQNRPRQPDPDRQPGRRDPGGFSARRGLFGGRLRDVLGPLSKGGAVPVGRRQSAGGPRRGPIQVRQGPEDSGGAGDLRPVQQDLPQIRRRPRHAHRRGKEASGNQQAGRHQQPQGVLQPRRDPPPQQAAQQNDHQDQHPGGQKALHHASSPLARSNMALSAWRSSSVRPRPSAMVFTSSPTLPR